MDRRPYDRPDPHHDRTAHGRDYDEGYPRPAPLDPVAHSAAAGYSPRPIYPTPTSANAGPSRSQYDPRYDYDYESQWASSSRHPHAYPSPQYGYPYSPHPPHAAGLAPGRAEAPPAWGGHWGIPPGYRTTSPGVIRPPPRAPTPPPPASPSQIQRPPPPPASAPSPADRPSSPSGYLPGFQPDYDRPGETRRPGSVELSSTGGAVSVSGSEVRPPPSEAYVLLRPHRVPRGGWETGSDVASHTSDSAGWTFELEVLQHPERGKALGVEHLRRGWPPLTPPLIVQMIVKDKDGQVIPTDNATLARRLVHITMNVELVAPDSSESRSLMRVRPPSPRGNVQPYYPASAPPPYSVQKTLLGSTVRTAQVLTRDGRKGFYFIFQDMVVRPEGRYALEGKVLDLAGPPHIGTSIGVTHPLAHCRANVFDVIVPQEYPGPVPITPLSQEFLRQGERHLGVSAAQLAASAKQKRRPRNEDGDSEQDDGAAAD